MCAKYEKRVIKKVQTPAKTQTNPKSALISHERTKREGLVRSSSRILCINDWEKGTRLCEMAINADEARLRRVPAWALLKRCQAHRLSPPPGDAAAGAAAPLSSRSALGSWLHTNTAGKYEHSA